MWHNGRMNKKSQIKNFKVSCSGWEIDVDSDSFESAALSGLIIAFKKFNSNLLLSTTIMVSDVKFSTKNLIDSSEFFSTEKMLRKLGLNYLSEGLSIISKAKLEKELSVAS